VARAERPESSADLPQIYENPWGLLGRDLRAVVADAGLQLRILWRRNRQGEFSVPGFWPGSLQPLFWPLLLALVLALLLALPWLGSSLLPRGPGPETPGSPGQGAKAPEPTVRSPLAPAPPDPGPVAAAPDFGRPLPRTPAAAEQSPSADARSASPAGDSSRSGRAPGPAGLAASPSSPSSRGALPPTEPAAGEATAEAADQADAVPPVDLDPLLEMLADADPQQLIASAHPDPGLALLRLTLAPAYRDLPEASRQTWAERWCERAQELGYERLELVDGQQHLLGRRALVGSGMILLDPEPRL